MLRARGLVSLEKSAAIRNASKNAGNQFRLVVVAETEIELIFLREIQVQAHIKLLLVLHEYRRIRIVIEQATVGRKRIKVQESNRIGIQPVGGNNVAGEWIANKA